MTELADRNRLVRDADGQWYSIPPNLEKEFVALKEEMYEMDTCGEEYFEACARLNDTFSQYMKD